MRRSIPGILLGLALLCAVLAVGYALASRLAPERLRAELVERLSRAAKSPVGVGEVRLALGIGIQVVAEDVRLWPGPTGPGLRVERVAIGVEPLSLLTGSLRPRRMVLRGAHLRVERGADDRFHPAPFRFLDRDPPRPGRRHPSELLSPLIAVENALRWLLRRPYLADTFVVRDSEILLMAEAPRSGRPGEDDDPREGSSLAFALEIDDASVRHRRLRGDAQLELRGRLRSGQGQITQLEWTGERDRRGAARTSVALQGLRLDAVETYVRRLQPRARIAGEVSGRLDFAASAPGEALLEIDLVARDLEAAVPHETHPVPGLSASQLAVGGLLEITPDRVLLNDAHLRSGDLALRVDGSIARPLQASSVAQLKLAFQGVDLARARSLLEWLPDQDRDEIVTFVAPVVEGRLTSFEAGGGATLADWEGFFGGGVPIFALSPRGEAQVADLMVRVGEEDFIDRIGGRIAWSGERLEVDVTGADLNGRPLPSLDLALDGVTRLLDADPERRILDSSAAPLAGWGALLDSLGFDDDDEDDPSELHTSLALEIDHLQHPMFLWPIERLRAVVDLEEREMSAVLREGVWGGVAVSGNADWRFGPEPHVRIALVAERDRGEPLARDPDAGWATGRLVVGAIDDESWTQSGAAARFSATGATLRLHDVEADLLPSGRIRGSARVDLSRPDRAGFQLNIALSQGDVEVLSRQLGLAPNLATGRVDAWGTVEGTLRPDTPAFSDAMGVIELAAADGVIHHSLPAIVAVALASEALNPFAQREAVRYEEVRSQLEFADGVMTTDAFWVDGPDIRVLASGTVDLAREPHPVDAEVALFLFRQLDRAIDSIPILNILLRGTRENLMAAYFELSGPWEDPKTSLVPLKSLNTGPATLVLDGLPRIVRKGLSAIGAILGGSDEDAIDSYLRAADEKSPWES